MPPSTLGTRKIVLVEDDEATRDIFGTVLRHHGYEVVEAEDGPSGVEAIRRELPNLVLLDIGLPRMDGWEVAEAIRSAPETGSIPILVVTANAELDGPHKADAFGCRAYLRKPLDPKELVRRVEECLEGR